MVWAQFFSSLPSAPFLFANFRKFFLFFNISSLSHGGFNQHAVNNMSLTHWHVGECCRLPATLSSSLLACCSVSSVWNDIWLNYAMMSSRGRIKGDRTHARCFSSTGRLVKLWLMSKRKINEASGQRGVLTSRIQPVHLLYISVYRCQGWLGGGVLRGFAVNRKWCIC